MEDSQDDGEAREETAGPGGVFEIEDFAFRRREAREDLERAIPKILRLAKIDRRFTIVRRLRVLRGRPR